MYKITHPSFERDMEYTEPFDFADFVGICVGFLVMDADCRGDWRQRVPIEKDKSSISLMRLENLMTSK